MSNTNETHWKIFPRNMYTRVSQTFRIKTCVLEWKSGVILEMMSLIWMWCHCQMSPLVTSLSSQIGRSGLEHLLCTQSSVPDSISDRERLQYEILKSCSQSVKIVPGASLKWCDLCAAHQGDAPHGEEFRTPSVCHACRGFAAPSSLECSPDDSLRGPL